MRCINKDYWGEMARLLTWLQYYLPTTSKSSHCGTGTNIMLVFRRSTELRCSLTGRVNLDGVRYTGTWEFISCEPEGCYHCSKMFHQEPEGRYISLFKDFSLRTRRTLSLFKDFSLRTRRAISLFKILVRVYYYMYYWFGNLLYMMVPAFKFSLAWQYLGSNFFKFTWFRNKLFLWSIEIYFCKNGSIY